MTEQTEFVSRLLEDAKSRARDGSQILKELAPDLPWEKMENLVGDRILVIEVEPGYSQFADDALRVTFAKEDDTLWRITSIYNIINRKLRKLEDYLPAWVTVVNWRTTCPPG